MIRIGVSIMDIFNPLSTISSGDYISTWSWLLENILSGYMARFIAVVCYCAAFWFAINRQNLVLAGILFGVTLLFAYFGSIAKACFWWAY